MYCLVCQTPCSGFHYKISSCRACAGFFRRTVQKKLRYRCKQKRNCPISKETRFSCRFCRMQKCLAVGMVMEDETVFSPNFHLDTSDSISAPINDVQLPNLKEERWFTTEAIFNNNEQFIAFMKDKCIRILNKTYVPSRIPSTICQQSASAYELHETKWPKVKMEMLQDLSVQMMEQFLVDYCKEMIHIADFLMGIEPFTRLPLKEKVGSPVTVPKIVQALIFPRYGQTFFCVNRIEVSVKYLGNDIECPKTITHGGAIFDFKNTRLDMSSICNIPEDQFKEMMLRGDTQFDTLFVKNFKKVLPDDFEVQYLLMRSLWSLHGIEGISKKSLAIADEVLSRLDDEIAYYYKYEKKLTNVASRIYKLHNLVIALERVAENRMEDQLICKTFDVFKLDLFIDDLGV